MEPLVDHHESKMTDLHYLITQTFNSQLLKMQELCQGMLQTKLDKVTHENEMASMKKQMTDTQDIAAFYKNHFMKVENFIEKYLPVNVQKQIGLSLMNMLSEKDNKLQRYKEYEGAYFQGMSESILKDDGIADLVQSMKRVYKEAYKHKVESNGGMEDEEEFAQLNTEQVKFREEMMPNSEEVPIRKQAVSQGGQRMPPATKKPV